MRPVLLALALVASTAMGASVQIPQRNASGGGYDIKGTTDGSSASCGSGRVGEVCECSSSGVSTASGGTAVLCSVTLTAGDWDVSGSIYVSGQSGLNAIAIGLNTTSNTSGTTPKNSTQVLGIGGTNTGGTIPPFQVTISSSSQNWGINASPNGNSTNVTIFGFVHARRMR